MEAQKNEDEGLKIVNLIELKGILNDQEMNKSLQFEKEKIIQKNKIYYFQNKNRKKNLLSETLNKQII